MTANEKFATDGLFTAIHAVKPLPFAETFPPNQLDVLFLCKHGQGRITPFFENVSVSDIASLLSAMFGDKWAKDWELSTSPLLDAMGASETTKETTVTNGKETNQQGTTTNNSLSAFDTEGFSDKDKTAVNANGETATENTKSRTYQKTKGDKVAEILQSAKTALRDSLIFGTIMVDVKSTIIMPIYMEG